jgi:hypothetical protein
LQYQLPFTDPTEPSRTLPSDATLWFATFNGRVIEPKIRRDTPHRLPMIEQVIKALRGFRSAYVTQCLFRTRVWRVAFFAAATHLWLDLDGLRGMQPYLAIALILRCCRRHLIPLPSVIVSSGRGYYAKWYLDQPLLATPRGNEAELVATLNAALADLLAPCEPDSNTHDAASLLRVIGSINARGGEVRIVWHNGRQAPHGYALSELCRALDVEPAGWQARLSGVYEPSGQRHGATPRWRARAGYLSRRARPTGRGSIGGARWIWSTWRRHAGRAAWCRAACGTASRTT